MVVSHKVCLPFVRSHEPNFAPKDGIRFEIPVNLLESRFQDIGMELEERFSDDNTTKLPVKSINLPDLTLPKKLPRDAQFSVFIDYHRKMAEYLMKIFNDCNDIDELIAMALYVRDQVNPYMFVYSYSVVLTHRKDTQNILLPTIFEIFPTKFISRDTLIRAREEAFVVPDENLRRSIDIPKNYTSSDIEPEQRMAYFREDIGINSHHFHWHQVYPFGGPDRQFFDKDRRGELFYYMHHQILARYNTGRLAAGLHMTVKFVDFRQRIATGYYPKMNTINSSRSIPPRQTNAILGDLKRDQDFMELTVNTLEMHRDRISECIDLGYCLDWQGNRVDLDTEQGIDVLGNIIEASFLSPNMRYFGSIHNDGHSMFSFCHDPKNSFKENAGVMTDTTTAMRDPIFYCWHTFVNELFQQHKFGRPPYTNEQLTFENIQIENVDFILKGKLTNELITFWQKSEANLGSGLDYSAAGVLLAKFEHLNHENFNYRISVNNTGIDRKGTVRIFMAPTNGEENVPFLYEGIRKIFIEMDRFVVNLKSGLNKIYRKSEESSVIIPFNRTFPKLNVNQQGEIIPSTIPMETQQWCQCGWPAHMLLPKGTDNGLPFKIFVMISDYNVDAIIDQDNHAGLCSESIIFCGIRDKKYPDTRSMGFPFDRPDFSINTIEDFINGRNNMFVKNFTIKHINKILKTYKALNLEIQNVSQSLTTTSTITATTTTTTTTTTTSTPSDAATATV